MPGWAGHADTGRYSFNLPTAVHRPRPMLHRRSTQAFRSHNSVKVLCMLFALLAASLYAAGGAWADEAQTPVPAPPAPAVTFEVLPEQSPTAFVPVETPASLPPTEAPTQAPTQAPTAVPLIAPTDTPIPPSYTSAPTGVPPIVEPDLTATSIVGAVQAFSTPPPLRSGPPPPPTTEARVRGLPRTNAAPFPTQTATSIPTVTPTATVTPTPPATATATPSWLPPGPECKPQPGKVLLQLDVPYIHQVKDLGKADGNWACGPTSVAMVLAYYGKLVPWQDYLVEQGPDAADLPPQRHAPAATSHTPALTPIHTATRTPVPRPSRVVGADFAPYVTDVYSNSGHVYSATAPDPRGNRVAGLYGAICPTGLADWALMASVLQRHGLTTRQIGVSWEGVTAALKRGHPVLLGNGLTAEGHILVAVGYTANNQLIVNDPYGNRFAPGYGSTNGAFVPYPWQCTRTRNALEVIGAYPPPTSTSAPSATPDAEATLTVPAASAPPFASEAPSPQQLEPTATPGVEQPSRTAKATPLTTGRRGETPRGGGTPLPVTAKAGEFKAATVDNAAAGAVFSWGLFSAFSLATVLLYRRSRKMRHEKPHATEGE